MNSLVVTSINGNAPALEKLAKGALDSNFRFILIGDRKGPKEVTVSGIEFYDINQQYSLKYELANLLPENHYARKNIGYLIGMEDSEYIIETDDDNIPKESFFYERNDFEKGEMVGGDGWCNVYSYFSDKNIWPRGLPLEVIQNVKQFEGSVMGGLYCPIQQGLADEDPDVDAIYRLVIGEDVVFKNRGPVILVDKKWCPFNSQNTTWFKKVFPLMYLPSYCSFRMTDIWRSFVAQNWVLSRGYGVLFTGATVYQERNQHDFMVDFQDEVVGYLNNEKIRGALIGISCEGDVYSYLENAYGKLVELGVVSEDEMQLVSAWNNDVSKLMMG